MSGGNKIERGRHLSTRRGRQIGRFHHGVFPFLDSDLIARKANALFGYLNMIPL